MIHPSFMVVNLFFANVPPSFSKKAFLIILSLIVLNTLGQSVSVKRDKHAMSLHYGVLTMNQWIWLCNCTKCICSGARTLPWVRGLLRPKLRE